MGGDERAVRVVEAARIARSKGWLLGGRVTEQLFFSQDPRVRHPGWSKTIWSLIEKGEVAIGMTRAMAEVACGFLGHVGTVLEGDAMNEVYSCGGGRRFLIANGKVTKYVE